MNVQRSCYGYMPDMSKKASKEKKIGTAAFRKEAAVPAVCSVLIVILIVLMLLSKEGLFGDEFFSYARANARLRYIPAGAEIPDPASYFQSFLAVDRPFIYGTVIEREAGNVHPPLYFILLHTVCSFFPGSFSVFFAGAVNMLFAVLSVFVLHSLLKRFALPLRTRAVLLLGIVISPGILINGSFLRMYVMLGFFMLSLSCLFLSGRKRDLLYYILLFLTVFGGIMTHYHFLIFLFFASAVYLVILLREKRFHEIGFHALTVAAAGGVSLLCFPAMISQILFSNRGTEAQAGFLKTAEYLPRIRGLAGSATRDLFGSLIFLLIPAAAAAAFLLCERKRAEHEDAAETEGKRTGRSCQEQPLPAGVFLRNYLLLVVPPALCGAVIAVTAGFHAARYLFPLYPFIILSVTLLFAWFLRGIPFVSRAADLLLLVFIFLFTAQAWRTADFYYLFRGSEKERAALTAYGDTDCVFLYNDPEQQWAIFSDYMELGCYRSLRLVQEQDRASLEELFSRGEDLIIVEENQLTGSGYGENVKTTSLLKDLTLQYGTRDSLTELGCFSATTRTFRYDGGGAP